MPTRLDGLMEGSALQLHAFVFIAAAFAACASAASAQPGPAGAAAGDGGAVLRNGDAGALRAAVDHAGARLIQDSPAPAQAKNIRRESWVARHPVIAGASIGTAAGAALSRIDAIGGTNHDARVALLGTGAGAWGGVVASAVQKARRKERIGLGTKIVIVAGAVGLVVLPVLGCYGAGGCGGSS